MDLEVIRWEGVDLIYVPQNRDKRQSLMNVMINFRVP
jgi:hypothetical protein